MFDRCAKQVDFSAEYLFEASMEPCHLKAWPRISIKDGKYIDIGSSSDITASRGTKYPQLHDTKIAQFGTVRL
ncbi:hypothetical protein NOG11_12310 [Parvularcula sp. BGMRC 0090]|uniref:Uncharacterized protein n=1 Tax=Parvularcula maris TaxID=2965077 RepID=A0A9X2LAY8_9PROT|nr:hypothetical protein [Parvularcula maris]MCQ8186163.1 hypothetical protein [Parvularcula maris]